MPDNPRVDELLRQMRRRERFRPAVKSLDPTFKPHLQSGSPEATLPEPDLFDDDSLEAFLLADEADTPPPVWKRAIEWFRDESREIVRLAVAALKEDGAVTETLAGVAILAAGTAVGFLWHAYRGPIATFWAGLVDVVCWIVSILGHE